VLPPAAAAGTGAASITSIGETVAIGHGGGHEQDGGSFADHDQQAETHPIGLAHVAGHGGDHLPIGLQPLLRRRKVLVEAVEGKGEV